VSIRMDDIKDPRLRARIEDALGASESSAAGTRDTGIATSPGYADRPASPTRIRQDPKPLMNKLEQDWFNVLSVQYPNYPRPRPQAKRYRLGNGIWYKPDVSVSTWPNRNPDGSVGSDMETCWEVKGPHAFRGGFENLKVAAGLWPEVRWILVWRERGEWHTQEVLT
jgi:hypothetical protein